MASLPQDPNGTRAHDFMQRHLLPSLAEWEKDETNEQKAMNLAVNLSQMADYFWHSFRHDVAKVLGTSDEKAFRKILRASKPQFALINDVADAHKHFKLSRADRNLTSAGQTVVAPMGWGEAKFGEGRWGSPPEVVVTYDDGTKHHFSTAVRAVVQMWLSWLA